MSYTIAIGSDHAGYLYKSHIINTLGQIYTFTDLGTHHEQSVDYPDFAHPVASAVEDGSCRFGILVCGSGNGVAITANKHQGARAALCWNADIARLAREHNDANILCLPARFISPEEAVELVKTFLETPFEGGRHAKRVEKISC
jgi:ribose 5-phosphate isomerase B